MFNEIFERRYYQLQSNGYIENFNGWVMLWAFLFGPLWFMYRGLWFWAVYAIIANLALFLVMDGSPFAGLPVALVMCVFAPRLLDTSYQRKGYTRLYGAIKLGKEKPKKAKK